jgi:hypothetical protein
MAIRTKWGVTMVSIQDLTVQAPFVFEGQIEQLGASAVNGFPASSETAVVSVTSILKSSQSLAGYVGQRVTVQLQPPVTLQAGQGAVFFTEGVYFGDGLVVREIGNAPSGEPTMAAQMNSAAQAGEESEMAQRIAQADLVVTGTASEPARFVSAQAGGGRVSEHDPDYFSVTITVETVEKGAATPGQAIQVLFPNSNDIAWYRSPKIKAGDHGVWLLHNRDLSGKPVPGLAVIHPLDFRPIEELGRVRALLRTP